MLTCPMLRATRPESRLPRSGPRAAVVAVSFQGSNKFKKVVSPLVPPIGLSATGSWLFLPFPSRHRGSRILTTRFNDRSTVRGRQNQAGPCRGCSLVHLGTAGRHLTINGKAHLQVCKHLRRKIISRKAVINKSRLISNHLGRVPADSHLSSGRCIKITRH